MAGTFGASLGSTAGTLSCCGGIRSTSVSSPTLPVTRNLTPDAETGLGKWSDAEIARAIRSGVSRDGYQLHWQGMIWDHASNWDETDLRAVIAYLRALPPVKNKVMPDRAPAPDDCEIYTFWTSESHTQGCQ